MSDCQRDNSWTIWDITMKFLPEQDIVKSSDDIVRKWLHPMYWCGGDSMSMTFQFWVYEIVRRHRYNCWHIFTFQTEADEPGGTEAGSWSSWHYTVVMLVTAVGTSLFIIICVAVVICKYYVGRTLLPARTTFKRSVTWPGPIAASLLFLFLLFLPFKSALCIMISPDMFWSVGKI